MMKSFGRRFGRALPALAILASAGAASAEDLSGTWTGKFTQSNQPGAHAVAIDFSKQPITFEYKDQSCGGTLEKVGAKGNASFYIETITKGGIDPATGHGCVNGTITLIRTGDSLVWGWIGEHKGQPLSATATLSQKH